MAGTDAYTYTYHFSPARLDLPQAVCRFGVPCLYVWLPVSDRDFLRLFIVDDHALLRQGLKTLIADEADLCLVGEAATATDAAAFIRERPEEIDLVILDLSLPDGSGLGVLSKMRDEGIDLPVLILTRHPEELQGQRTLQAGAQGFLEKSGDPERVIEAARQVAAGEIVISEHLQERILRQFSQGGAENQHPVSRLSDREFEVFELIGKGKTAREMAELLHISPKTVHTYRQRIKEKLDADSSSELMRLAVTWVEGGL